MARHTEYVQHEADEAVVRRKRQENAVNQQDVLEVVYHALAVQIVHGCAEEVPVERFCEAQTPRPAWHVDDGDNFLERHHLQRRDHHYDVDVAGQEGEEKAADHDEGPYRPGDERLLLLFVLVLFRGLLWCGLSMCFWSLCLLRVGEREYV